MRPAANAAYLPECVKHSGRWYNAARQRGGAVAGAASGRGSDEKKRAERCRPARNMPPVPLVPGGRVAGGAHVARTARRPASKPAPPTSHCP